MKGINKANQLLAHKRLIKKYLAQGLNIRAITILLKPKLAHEMTYHGVRAWLLRNNLISHAKRSGENSNE